MRFLCICVCDYNNEAEDKTTTGWTNSKAIPSWEVTAGGTKQCPPPPLTRSSLCPYTHYTNNLNPIKIVEKNYGQTHMCLQTCVHVGCQDLGKVSHALRKPPSKAPKITTSRVNATKIHGKRVSFVCWLAGWLATANNNSRFIMTDSLWRHQRESRATSTNDSCSGNSTRTTKRQQHGIPLLLRW